jgi:adenosylcobinamide-phosphate synthase
MIFNTYYPACILLSAVILDLLIGDPDHAFHPVRLFGKTIEFTEKIFRKFPLNPKISGSLFNISNILFWAVISSFIIKFINFNEIVFVFISSLMIYSTISLKCLMNEARQILAALEKDDIILARHNLSRIVGRDTQNLDKSQISMATIESISENFVDGIISPFFYAFLGGPPGAVIYRVINTMDSMVGYKNEKYKDFGFFSAKLDDFANYIPARLSIIFIAIASIILGKKNILGILKDVYLESRHHSSPNSGIPESCFAYCLDIKLSGPSSYKGVRVEREFINQKGRLPETEEIKEGIKLLFLSAMILYGTFIAVSFMIAFLYK